MIGWTFPSNASVSAAGSFVGSDILTGGLVCPAQNLFSRMSWRSVKAVCKDCTCDAISIAEMQAKHMGSLYSQGDVAPDGSGSFANCSHSRGDLD